MKQQPDELHERLVYHKKRDLVSRKGKKLIAASIF